MGDNSGMGYVVAFALGMLTAGVIIHIATSNKKESPAQTAAMAPASPQPYILVTPAYSHTQDTGAEIQRLYAEIQRLRQENEELRAQIAAPKVIKASTASPSEPKAIQGVQNEEEWIIKKDVRGRLDGIKVHRRVTPIA